MRFDWTDLRVFLHACETGSMTQAANRSNLTLAAVSARIRALEEGVGIPLLRRHARGVVATPAGEALARHARLLFHQREVLRRDVSPSRPSGITQTLVLANSSAMVRPLARVVGHVLGCDAASRIAVRESSSEVTVHALHAGTADVGVVTDAAHTDGLITQPLGPDPLVLVAPPNHVLASRDAIRFEEALAFQWIACGEASALHTHLVMHAFQAGRALEVRADVPSAQGVLELVASGWGVGVLPRAVLHRLGAALQIAVIPLSESWAQRQLLVCRSPQPRTASAAAVFDAFKAQWAALEASIARAGESPASRSSAPL
jgi:DNA-binding transcriptional LysR family regulator